MAKKSNLVAVRLTEGELQKLNKIVKDIQEDCPAAEITLSDAIRWSIRAYTFKEGILC